MNRRSFLRNAGWVSTGLIFVPRLLRAQTVLTADGLAAFKKKATAGGGGGSGYTLLAHNIGSVAASGTATTPAINSTGATLLTLHLSWYDGTPTVTDLKGNSLTGLTTFSDGSPNYNSKIYYCLNPGTVGSGHQFTATSVNGYCILAVAAWSGGAPALDNSNGYNHPVSENDTTFQTGAASSSSGARLVIAGFTWNTSGVTVTGVDNSFAILNQTQEGSDSVSNAFSYLLQSAGASVNPTATFSGTVNAGAASIAAFK